jgi:hypothetical protein
MPNRTDRNPCCHGWPCAGHPSQAGAATVGRVKPGHDGRRPFGEAGQRRYVGLPPLEWAQLASWPYTGCCATTERSFDDDPVPLGDATALLMA